MPLCRRFLEGSKIAFTGQGKVPVIVDENQGGKWVNDSWAIAQYLEATYPGHPSLFGGPAGAAWLLTLKFADVLLVRLSTHAPKERHMPVQAML